MGNKAVSVERIRKQVMSINVLLGGIFPPGFLPNTLKFTAFKCCLQETHMLAGVTQQACKKLSLKTLALNASSARQLIFASYAVVIRGAPRLLFHAARSLGSGELSGHRALTAMHRQPLCAWLSLRNLSELSRQHRYRK